MKLSSVAIICLAGVVLAESRSVASTKVSSLVSDEPRISPPLHDGGEMNHGEHQSDKKFFGPPFPADYPEDKRPAPDKNILDKLKGASGGLPYPALQSKDDFDKDFVKDENSDTGAWQAQFEYDALRKKLAEEEAAEKRAQARADREGSDVDDAQREADRAAGKVREAVTGDKSASDEEDRVKTADDFGGPPSAEKLEELKKAVKAAEEKFEEQKKAFEKCKQQLEEAKKNLEELKAAQVELEKKLAAETKLWAEQKTVKFNLKKSNEAAASAKVIAAKAKLAAAEKVKADLDKVLAKEQSEHEKAKANLHKETAEYTKAQKNLEAASSKLQKIHGYKPAQADPTPTKSGGKPIVASMVSVAVSMIAMTWAF